ncbi:hypothetical protein [Leptodesmis sp.]|uniref:hypothetical protein n=1 Tax=Leptodesmis sp. TaxID=3100501 RepID=UPI0040535872
MTKPSASKTMPSRLPSLPAGRSHPPQSRRTDRHLLLSPAKRPQQRHRPIQTWQISLMTKNNGIQAPPF